MFFTASVIVATVLLAVEVSYDGWSTQYLLSKGHTELDPLARWLVYKGTLGQIAACSLGLGASLLAGYLFGHWAIWAVVVGEGLNCYRQYTLVKEE